MQKWLRDGQTVIIDAKESTIQSNLLNTFSIDSDVVSVNPIYTIDKGAEMGITNEFVVQFLDNVSQSSIDSLNKIYNIKIVKKSFYYLLKVPPKSDVLKIANTYYETGFAKFSHPNFIMQISPFHIPNDTYFNEQWNFYNTGQTINDGHVGTTGADIKATQAWDITEGSSSVTIAVIDEGVTSDHPDLSNSRQVRLNGSNFADGNANDPSPNGTVDNHGNACAGLIAATQDNNEGITGLAPNCKIMPIKIFNGDESGLTDNSLIADAITFAYTNGADIISNSWGFNTSDPNAVPVIVTAIQNATTLGRNGKGCVVAFSAGNTATHSVGGNGYVGFPANVNIPGVLTVGASDRDDGQADYSPTSDPNSNQNQLIDVVAPSHRAYPPAVYQAQGLQGGIAGETFEVWSIDMPTILLGYNEWPNVAPYNLENIPGEELPNTGTNFDAFTGRFGGTSAACPQVAGLAALILSVNPNLTQQQVYNIITSTADKVGGYTYDANGFSNEIGFGRINACSAVSQALGTTLSISGDDIITCSSAVYSITPSLNSSASVTWSINPDYSVFQLEPNTPAADQLTIVNNKWYQAYTTLSAVINTGCSSSQPVTVTKSINNYSNIPSSYTYTQEACTYYNVFHPQQTGTVLTNGTPVYVNMGCTVYIDLGTLTQDQVFFYGTVPITWGVQPTTYGQNTLYFELPNTSNGPFQFYLGSSSSCYELMFFSKSNNENYVLSASPNPATSTINVSVTNVNSNSSINSLSTSSTTSSSSETSSMQSLVSNSAGITNMYLYDFYTNQLVKKWNYQENSSTTYNLNVSGVKRGMYVLKMERDNVSAITKVILQ